MKQLFAAACSLLLAVFLAACGSGGENPPAAESAAASALADTGSSGQTGAGRQMRITTTDGKEVLFALNESTAARELYDQLPLSVGVEDYGGNEKIFYPPEKLDTTGAPPARGPAGTLAYYAPWGDVAVFYGECGGASGLYALGEAVSGVGYLPQLSGEIRIEAVFASDAPGKEEAGGFGSGQRAEDEADTSSYKKNMQIAVGSKTFSAALYDNNEAARAFSDRLPLTLPMNDLHGSEENFYLADGLAAVASRPAGIQSGDLMLYGFDCLVLFYESFSSSYSDTPLGTVDDPSGLAEALGSGNVSVTFESG